MVWSNEHDRKGEPDKSISWHRKEPGGTIDWHRLPGEAWALSTSFQLTQIVNKKIKSAGHDKFT